MGITKIFGFFIVEEKDLNAIIVDMIKDYNCKIIQLNKKKNKIMIMCYV
jgi:hypothetical protein